MHQPVDYSDIASLVENTSTRGPRLEVQFRCPETGQSVTGHGTLPSSNSGRSSRSSGGGSVIVSILVSIFQNMILRRLGLGRGSRRAARLVTRGVTRNGMGSSSGSSPTSAEKNRAIVEAFQEVRNRFTRRPDGRWVMRS